MFSHLPRTRLLALNLCLLLITTGRGRAQAPDGKSLFQIDCAQCHNPVSVVVGPALKGVTERVPDRKLLHAWIHNNVQVLGSGNVYFNNLFNQYGRAPMNTFPGLTDDQIDAILSYVENYAQPLAATNTSNYPNASLEDHTVLYGIVSFILALFVFGLYLINNNLKQLADEKSCLPQPPAIPFYRKKSYIATASIVVMGLLGWWLTAAGIGLGRQQGYRPEQPIYFSHRVHAGLNQISCLLCHGNALEGKQASVPSLNFCMNCHAAITVYHGERLAREDGSPVDPNEELHKLFRHTGYDPDKRAYTRNGDPVEWVRIHTLPDHVFFSHAQHVHAGKIQCQTCHGPVQTMDEVYQFAPLSMGWCINCHRTTRVDFPDSESRRPGNKFYGIYTRLAAELKNGERDSVTVEDIGGTECQKCHY
jgi:cytochrome c551/c552